MSAVTNQSLLSPALLYAEFNAKYGANTVTNFGLLDPTLAEKQMNDAIENHSPDLPAAFRKNGPLDKGVTDPGWSPPGLGTALGI